jgi:CubicO group peptidase (beta-lactamase class C family)
MRRRNFLRTSLAAAGAFLIGLVASSISMPNDLDTFIEDIMEQSHIPGLSACIVKDSDTIWSKGYGWADIENQIPMTPDIVQNIGSVSKTVTATALMQLWEKGLFKLDDDVNGYLPFKVQNPHFPDTKITFRQLLTHRSSIMDGPAYDESYASGDPQVSLDVWLKEYFTPGGKYYDRDTNFHKWKPGETGEIPATPRAYTNVGFGLLGYLVERISRVSFGEYTKEHIFTPLDMNETSWYIRDIDAKKQAVPYIYVSAEDTKNEDIKRLNEKLGLYKNRPVKEGFLPLGLYSFPNIPDGLVRTSVHQLARFLMMYIGEGNYKGTTILQKATVDTMLSDNHFGRALCWYQTQMENVGNVWLHSGGDPGIRTVMMFSETNKTGVIIFTNGPGDGIGKIITRLFEEAATHSKASIQKF